MPVAAANKTLCACNYFSKKGDEFFFFGNVFFRLSESVLLSSGRVSGQTKAQPLAFQLGLVLSRFNRFAVDKTQLRLRCSRSRLKFF